MHSFVVRILVMFFFVGVVLIYATCRTSENEINTDPFPLYSGDFDTYQLAVSTYLTKTKQVVLDEHDLSYEVSLVEPFQYFADRSEGYFGRFLLIHGFTDSTYLWREAGLALSQAGFDTRGILLSGHGSRPEAMLDVSWKSWLDEAQAHIDALLMESSEPLYLGGYSMGGIIATILLERNPEISGLLVFAPAYRVPEDLLLYLSPMVGMFTQWLSQDEEISPIRYNSRTTNAVTQFHYLTREFQRTMRNKDIKRPVFMVLTDVDTTIDSEYARMFFQEKVQGPDKKLLTYSNSISESLEDETIISPFSARDQIINQSHVSLLASPDNELYGIEGALLGGGGVVFPDVSSDKIWYGEYETDSDITSYILRTTYNPHFNQMTETIVDFFRSVYE